ncbi:MAG: SDR family oxidoreductase [Magnetococcales bacterium]|nr:SDR family oxidoreductase [Magnetococcales bacterium]
MATPEASMRISLDLAGHTALVTGAGRRIGAACAEALAGAGARVAVHHQHSGAEAEALCQRITRQGGRAEPFAADLTEATRLPLLLAAVGQRLGRVTILVNNAAIFAPGTLRDTPLTAWQGMLATNLTAPFLLMQAFAQALPPPATGVIINLVDQRVLRPSAGHLAYSVAKSALWQLTQQSALELAPHIRVNAIAPGPILAAAGAAGAAFPQIAAATPLQRPGSPQDIVDALLFLIGHAFITGEMICVDGGEHL